MNEASSKYVDMIAMERLLQEKLVRVHHRSDRTAEVIELTLTDLAQIPPVPADTIEQSDGRNGDLSFRSPVTSAYPENNRVMCRIYTAEHPLREMIFLHGLFEENLQIYEYFISLLNEQGITVYLMILPYHYGRCPATSAFSGEYFWSGDLHRSALAYRQAVCDVFQLYQFLRTRSKDAVGVVGFSMGGGIVLSLAGLLPLDGVFVINPVCHLHSLVWTSPLFASIRGDLDAAGITAELVQKTFAFCEPLTLQPVATDTARIALARSAYDQINDQANYDLLVERWKLRAVHTYKAGHLNILRVPKLARDVARCVLEARWHELH